MTPERRNERIVAKLRDADAVLNVEKDMAAGLPPWETGYDESSHSRARDECVALDIGDHLGDARMITAGWKEDYNHRRPLSPLGFKTPAGFAAARAVSTSAKASAPAAYADVYLGQPQP